MSAEQFYQILKFGRERGRRSLVLSGALCTKLQRQVSCKEDLFSFIKSLTQRLNLLGIFKIIVIEFKLSFNCLQPHFALDTLC